MRGIASTFDVWRGRSVDIGPGAVGSAGKEILDETFHGGIGSRRSRMTAQSNAARHTRLCLAHVWLCLGLDQDKGTLGRRRRTARVGQLRLGQYTGPRKTVVLEQADGLVGAGTELA